MAIDDLNPQQAASLTIEAFGARSLQAADTRWANIDPGVRAAYGHLVVIQDWEWDGAT